MMLNITEQEAMDPAFHVDVKERPTGMSRTIGWQPGVVIAKDPLLSENGFLQVIRPNGQVGWIPQDMVKPYHAESDPTAKCVPERLPNGLIGSGPG
jgi:hypothetical protein